MKSIRRQLTRDLLRVTLLLIAASMVALYFAARSAATDQFDDTLDAKALAISTLTTSEDGGVRMAFPDHLFRSFEDELPRDYFELWNAGGRPIARSEFLSATQDLPRRAGTPANPARWNFTLPNGRAARAVGYGFEPKSAPGQSRTRVQLVVASDRDDLDESLWQLLGTSALAAALLIGATLWFIPRALRRGLQPLDQLGQQAEGIDARSLATRFPTAELPAELQPIAGRWNELLARLEASFERERRFSADLAHELRTPIAELRNLAECTLKWPDTRDPVTDRDTLAIASQMENLVTHILALARGEQRQLAIKLEPVDLDSLVRETWNRFAPRSATRGLSVNLSLHAARASADPALLRSIIGNLCDNAVEYAPPGSELRLTVEASEAGAVITVSNLADELTDDDMPKLFDRFWRKEAARTGGRHFGLGLSLAHSFATAMGWTLDAALDGDRRLSLRLVSGPPKNPAG